MSERKDDGGPAFPSSPAIGPNGELMRPVDIGCEGMSLRNYFAVHAPFTAKNAIDSLFGNPKPGQSMLFDDEHVMAELVRINFAYADAMIAESAK